MTGNNVRNAITCPMHDGADTSVTDSRGTRYRGYDAVRRRRKCARCGYAWTTYELSAGGLERLLDKQKIALTDIMETAKEGLTGE